MKHNCPKCKTEMEWDDRINLSVTADGDRIYATDLYHCPKCDSNAQITAIYVLDKETVLYYE